MPAAASQLEQISPAAERGESASPNLFPLLIAVIVYAAVRNLAEAVIKPLWFDELLTQIISRESSVAALWRALKTAVDGNPPLFYLIERTASHLAGNELISYRLPSILAFSCTLICVYVFVVRRSTPLTAIVCTCLIFLTPLFDYYADEARPYSMLVACVAFAMVCYQRAPRWLWILGLFASLCLANCLHYYGVIALSPFLGAELFFASQTRRFRPSVWAALLLAPLPVLFFRPLLAAMRALYPHYRSPQFVEAFRTYGDFFQLGTPWGFALAGVSFLAVLLVFFRVGRTWSGEEEARGLCPGSEDVLVMALVAYPAIVFVVARIMHGGYFPRYVLCAILGIAIAFRYVLDWLGPRGQWAAVACLFLALGTQEFSFWRTLPSNFGLPERPAADVAALVESVHRDDLPVVFSEGVEYLEIKHYAQPQLRGRIAVVVDPSGAYIYRGADTLENTMLALQQLEPSGVYGFSAFVAAHRSFLLYSDGTVMNWLPGRLIREGDQLTLMASEGNRRLFLVQSKAGS